MKFRHWIADMLFFFGHSLIILSAQMMGYKDTAKELKETKAHWLQTDGFKTKSKTAE